ncbi:hypothetical protein ACOSP7_014950 [Xanthoceras sorbifolium]
MVEVAIFVAGKVAEYLVDPIVQQLSNIWNYKTNFENLETEVRRLEARRDTVQHLVDESRRTGEYKQQANMECFNGLCSNPKKCHKHSRKATKKVMVVAELYGEVDFERVSY